MRSPESAAPLQSGDFVDELLALVVSMAPEFSAAVEAQRVAEAIRQRFGGERVYIPHRKNVSERDAAIKRDYLGGMRFADLERRYGLKTRQLIYIIKS
jgi:Mor family transcriptional regulator